MKTSLRTAGLALALTGALALAGCGAADPEPAGGTASGTGAVDIGDGKTIELPQGDLKIGLFLQSAATAFNQSLLRGAQDAAAKYGYTIEPIDGQFDLNKQLNQLQTAATNRTYDVAAVEPLVGASECAAMTRVLPAAGVLVVTTGTPCDTSTKPAGDELWVPGTLATVAGDTTYTYTRAFLQNAIKAFPGAQKVALVTGPELDPLVINQKQAVAELAETNPDFDVNFVYTDWTTPKALSATRDYLSANPDVTAVLSSFSPDVTRSVVTAMESVDMLGKVGLADQGATSYSVDQVKNGNMQFTLPYFPDEYGRLLVEAVHSAQMGDDVPRFISNIPDEYGTVEDPVVITRDNADDFTPRY
ncbi:sugar ABC transporter substrate-binding protein [Parafrankia elaeagni]|uniref:sugar ABC transporter substrate-binding protein n=1 Tax=Parafrankia elaeagni TaxID=222534 RepID=UPI00037DFA8F|nr:sugar ABC transporter substrate-binding protein [Parafrankia elaeagni]